MTGDYDWPPGVKNYLDDLQDQSRKLQQQIAEHADLSWAGASGSDRRSVVRTTLGADGLPEKFDVDVRWHQRISSHELAGAVNEAHTETLAKRSSEWAARATDPVQTRNISQPPPEVPTRAVPRRSIDELAEAAISGIAAARASRTANPRVGRGTEGGVSLELSPSGIHCEIDARWAGRLSGTEISDALNGALRSARSQLSAAPDNSEVVEFSSRNTDVTASELFEDSLAYLRNLASGS